MASCNIYFAQKINEDNIKSNSLNIAILDFSHDNFPYKVGRC